MIQTLAARLTVGYVLLFGITVGAVFVSTDLAVESSLQDRMDQELITHAREILDPLRSPRSSLALIHAAMQREGRSHGIQQWFYRYQVADGDREVSSDLREWPQELRQRASFRIEPGREYSLHTIALPQHATVRYVNMRGPQDGVIQVGSLFEENQALLAGIRKAFFLTLAIGGIAGYVLVSRAMSEVNVITRSADAIRSGGDLGQRIPEDIKGREINELAQAINKMLQRIDSLVIGLREVTNNIAHDLRSPLTRIRGTAEMTVTGDSQLDEYQKMAGMVIEESDRLIQLINTMLEIAEVDAGVRPLRSAKVDIGAVLEDARDLFLPVADEKAIALEVDLPEKEVCTCIDLARLQRVVANLVDNAIKYTPNHGRVTLSLKDLGNMVQLSVADTGVGIHADDIPRVFERFSRLEDPSRSTSGHGLGLSLAQSLVRAHRGDITVTSTPGEGSTFSVLLPRNSSACKEDQT